MALIQPGCPRTSSRLYCTWPGKTKPPPKRGLIPLDLSVVIRANPRRKKLLLRRLGFGVLSPEALHASGSIHQLLLAGKEGMAIRADFHADIALVGRPCHERTAA